MAETQGQKNKVETVMREFKEGGLKSSSSDKVTDRKQAIAIALSESGQSNHQPQAQLEEKARKRQRPLT